MTQPQKALGFLDLAGEWDPSLAFVMAGAVSVAFGAFRVLEGRERNRKAAPLALPQARAIDSRLLGGAALFGIGSGLAGFAPAPPSSASDS
jgi:uncharacterized membrane protein YedE/YeeE